MAGGRVRIPSGCKLPLPLAIETSGGEENGARRYIQACPTESSPVFEEDPVPGDSFGEGGRGSLSSSTGTRRGLASESGTGAEKYRKKKRWGIDDAIVQEILDILSNVIITPPAQIMETHFWDDNVDLQNLPPNDKDVCVAFKRWGKKLNGWNIRNYLEFYETPRTYLFQDIHQTGNVYYSLEDSLVHVSNYLENSFQDVTEFLQCLVNVIDRRIPKKNTIEVVSPPSTGKNWFFDMFVDFFLNAGHLKNMNRNSLFPFQDCANRRIILWNEPNCHPEFLDTLKTVYGGDRCPAAIKCKDDAVIYRTPVIVLSNNPIFPNNDALDARRYQYQMKYWSELKTVGEKKPTPLCIGKLLEKYNVSF